MRGIEYVIDSAGNKKAVLIDLSVHEELWEDFVDQVTAREREHEPRESLEDVKRGLRASVG